MSPALKGWKIKFILIGVPATYRYIQPKLNVQRILSALQQCNCCTFTSVQNLKPCPVGDVNWYFAATHNQPTNQPTNQTNKQNKAKQTKPNQPNKQQTLILSSFLLITVGKPPRTHPFSKKIHLSWHYDSIPHWQMLHGIHRRGGTSRKPKIRRRAMIV